MASIRLQVAEVEDMVNEKINNNLPVHAFVAPLEKASKTQVVSLTCSFRLTMNRSLLLSEQNGFL